MLLSISFLILAVGVCCIHGDPVAIPTDFRIPGFLSGVANNVQSFVPGNTAGVLPGAANNGPLFRLGNTAGVLQGLPNNGRGYNQENFAGVFTSGFANKGQSYSQGNVPGFIPRFVNNGPGYNGQGNVPGRDYGQRAVAGGPAAVPINFGIPGDNSGLGSPNGPQSGNTNKGDDSGVKSIMPPLLGQNTDKGDDPGLSDTDGLQYGSTKKSDGAGPVDTNGIGAPGGDLGDLGSLPTPLDLKSLLKRAISNIPGIPPTFDLDSYLDKIFSVFAGAFPTLDLQSYLDKILMPLCILLNKPQLPLP